MVGRGGWAGLGVGMWAAGDLAEEGEPVVYLMSRASGGLGPWGEEGEERWSVGIRRTSAPLRPVDVKTKQLPLERSWKGRKH